MIFAIIFQLVLSNENKDIKTDKLLFETSDYNEFMNVIEESYHSNEEPDMIDIKVGTKDRESTDSITVCTEKINRNAILEAKEKIAKPNILIKKYVKNV